MTDTPLIVCYKMDPLTADEVGDYAVDAITRYLPNDTGDPCFAEIAKDFGGKGTTCGFLVHWLLWRIRYLNASITNRTEKEDGLKYVSGANISRVFNSGRAPFRMYKKGTTPSPGDICFVSNGPPITEHVFVFLREEIKDGKKYWVIGEGGQKNDEGQECMRINTKPWDGTFITGKTGPKKLMGWIPIRELPLEPGAALFDGSTAIREPVCGIGDAYDAEDALWRTHAEEGKERLSNCCSIVMGFFVILCAVHCVY